MASSSDTLRGQHIAGGLNQHAGSTLGEEPEASTLPMETPQQSQAVNETLPAATCDWTTEEVAAWAESTLSEEFAAIIRREAIDGEALLELTDDDLQEVGLDDAEQRRCVLQCIRDAGMQITHESTPSLQERLGEAGSVPAVSQARSLPPPQSVASFSDTLRGQHIAGGLNQPAGSTLGEEPEDLRHLALRVQANGWFVLPILHRLQVLHRAWACAYEGPPC